MKAATGAFGSARRLVRAIRHRSVRDDAHETSISTNHWLVGSGLENVDFLALLRLVEKERRPTPETLKRRLTRLESTSLSETPKSGGWV
jgi:hypothetical protein